MRIFISKHIILLQPKFNEISDELIFKCLNNLLQTEKVDRVTIDSNNKLQITNKLFSFKRNNWNIWSGIIHASIELKFNEEKKLKELIYSVSFAELFGMCIVFLLFWTFATMNAFKGYGALIGILQGGFVLVITYIRHQDHTIDFKSALEKEFLSKK